MPAPPRRILATSGILIGILLGAVDGTVVGTAMPTAIADLGGVHIYFLVFSAFMLASTVSLPVWGRLSDIYGRRWFHLAGVLLFIGASALCGLARTMGEMAAFRALQGIGAGGLLALSFTMVADLYPLEQRARMQGVISGVWGLASLMGPPLGGWLTQNFSWRWVFFVNIPVGLLSAVLVQAAWKGEGRRERGRPDIPGAVLLALASFVLMMAFAFAGRRGWAGPWTLGCLAGAGILAALLVLVERRSPDPFLTYDLFRIPLFAAGAATGVCAIICMFAATTYMPLFVQGVIGTSALKAGMVLVPMTLTWCVFSASSGFLLLRLGYRTLAVTGMTLASAAYFLLLRVDASATWVGVAAPMVVLGAGLGMTVAPLLIAAQNAVPRSQLGAATSLTQFARAMGGAIAVAVMGILMSSALQERLGAGAGTADPDAIITLRDRLPPGELRVLVGSLAAGLHRVFQLALAIALAGLACAFTIPRGKAQDLKAAEEKARG